jgi:hypothetical protein
LDGESESTPRRDSSKTSKRVADSEGGTYGSLWTDAELRAAIAAYERLLDAERRGAPLAKAEVAEALVRATGRTRASVERRLQNISAVLEEHGMPRVSGYTPQAHYTARLVELLRERNLL